MTARTAWVVVVTLAVCGLAVPLGARQRQPVSRASLDRLLTSGPLARESEAAARRLMAERPDFVRLAMLRAETYAFAFVCEFEEVGLPGDLGVALPLIESGLRSDAMSRAGARGMFQFMPATARAMGLGDPEDPWASAGAAARYLAELLSQTGDLVAALAAYNGGPGRIDVARSRAGSRDFLGYRHLLPVETQSYPELVLGAARIIASPERYGLRPIRPHIVSFDARLDRNERLTDLARRLHLPGRAVARLNGLGDHATLKRGARIRLPGWTLECGRFDERRVAAYYGVPPAALQVVRSARRDGLIVAPTLRMTVPTACRVAGPMSPQAALHPGT